MALPLRDFAKRLATDLLVRSQGVALPKAGLRVDGSLWLPTRFLPAPSLRLAVSDVTGSRAGCGPGPFTVASGLGTALEGASRSAQRAWSKRTLSWTK